MVDSYKFSSMLNEFSQAKGVKLKLLVAFFRMASFYYGFGIIRFAFFPFVIIYRFYSEVFIGMDLPARTKIGSGLKIHHGYGLVVHGDTVIGRNCTLRQGVTIGNKISSNALTSRSPIIGDNVEFGANSILIGDVEIGSNVIIGAGVVVTKSIPCNSVVVGQSFRIL